MSREGMVNSSPSVFLKWIFSTDLESLLSDLLTRLGGCTSRPVNVSSHSFHFTCQFSLSFHRKTDDISWVVSKLQLAHGIPEEDEVYYSMSSSSKSVKSDVFVSPDVVTKCVTYDIVNNSPPSCIVYVTNVFLLHCCPVTSLLVI